MLRQHVRRQLAQGHAVKRDAIQRVALCGGHIHLGNSAAGQRHGLFCRYLKARAVHAVLGKVQPAVVAIGAQLGGRVHIAHGAVLAHRTEGVARIQQGAHGGLAHSDVHPAKAHRVGLARLRAPGQRQAQSRAQHGGRQFSAYLLHDSILPYQKEWQIPWVRRQSTRLSCTPMPSANLHPSGGNSPLHLPNTCFPAGGIRHGKRPFRRAFAAPSVCT